MNSKQQSIVESFGKGIAVVAGAGCGKTTTLVSKCKALLERNPSARFCAVSFTEKSVRDLKTSLTRAIPDLDFNRHWVKTIHGLCASILQEFPVAAGLQGGEGILLEDEADRLWNRSLEVLWSSNDNSDISEALSRLLLTYPRETLEKLLKKLRSLMSFGVQEFIQRSFDRPEVRDLWLVFESVYHRYQQSKSREGRLDFNDLELKAKLALQSGSVRGYFQSRFDLVMVDEFQDTNPLQGWILEQFVKPGHSNLCIVGDPKQSIYRFRDADVSVFQDLTERLSERHVLDQNYRSRPNVIEFVNQVCAPAFLASDLPYEPLRAEKPWVSDPSGVSLVEWEQEGDLADYLLSCQASGRDLSEYVILARSVKNQKTQTLIEALEAKGIPVLLGSGGRFYSDPRVQEGVALLRGWVSTENRLSQVQALRSPLIGVSDEWLFETKKKGSLFFERFFADGLHPVARALAQDYASPLRMIRLRPGQVLERILALDLAEEELYTPWASLWQRCEELSRQGLRFEEVVEQLSDAIENEKIEREIPAPAERGMVRVMTIHASKGLQFPRVILIDFEGPSKTQGRSGDLIWNRKLGVHLLNRDEEGETLDEDPENERWKALERASAVAESKRVFYVAVTRPEEELILFWKKDVKPPKRVTEAGYSSLTEDYWRGWVQETALPPAAEFVRNQAPLTSALTEGHAPGVRVDHFDPKPYRARHSPSEWMILNQCRLRYRFRFAGQSAEEGNEPEEPARGGSSAADVADQGKRIHRLIELQDEEGLVREFKTLEIGRESVRMLWSLLRSGPGIDEFSELGFEVPLSEREALVGMMDRLEVNREDQSIRIVDYKFTAGEKTDAELLSRYGLQLRLYAAAALKLLDFVPKRIEGHLIHLTKEGVKEVRAPLDWFQPSDLEATLQNLFSQVKGEDSEPTLGDHCRFCEFQTTCPAQN